MIPPKFIRVIALHPLTPRWLQVMILRFLLIYIAGRIGILLSEMKIRLPRKQQSNDENTSKS